MNYAVHYDRLIARAHGRNLTGCRERHHVIPRCMGGNDAAANIVELTPEEHYVAHQLLVKLHPHMASLAYAVVLMAPNCTGNKAYGWLRRRLGGMPKSPEHRAKIGAGNRGKIRSPETREKIASKLRGTTLPQSTLDKMSKALRGKKRGPLSAELRAKLSAVQKGRKRGPFSQEHRARMSASLIGNTRNVGKKHSPATIAKMSEARRAYWERQRA